MLMVVISDGTFQAELCGEQDPESLGIQWVRSLEEVPAGTRVVADLLFENTTERKINLKKTGAATIIINSVIHTLEEADPGYVRINGWPTFLAGEWIEAAGRTETQDVTEKFFGLLGKKMEWVPDQAGFITPRVIAMIINEAYFALSENVSSRGDIDTAMKLGTNYPYGPFEWAEKIGLDKVYSLLKKLSESNPRYQPASALSAPHLRTG